MSDSVQFIEVETKYRADDIALHDFHTLMQKFGLDTPERFLYVSSNDIYFVKGEEFLRYRTGGERREFTYKRKSEDKNNFYRLELNVPAPDSVFIAEKFADDCLGFKRNFDIHKTCWIYHADDAILVYYTVTDKDGNKANFIEIEVKEDLVISNDDGTHRHLTKDEAWAIITKWEKELSALGISPQNRLRKSLFEMYRQ
jgi:adenylate cyclase class IV